MKNNESQKENKLVVAIVLYKENILNSETYKSLIASCMGTDLAANLSLFIYDNSPEPATDLIETHPFEKMTYVHDASNSGLAKAYNEATTYARQHRIQWLMLLDQDSHITADYLKEVQKTIETVAHCVLVPQVIQEAHVLSPLLNHQAVAGGAYNGEEIVAINSGTVVDVNVIDQIEGFNVKFPLDYLDHWFYWRIYQEKITIHVLTTQLEHSLSVRDIKNVSEERLRSILRAEKMFILTYKPSNKYKYYRHYLLRMFKYLVKDPTKLKVAWNVLLE